MTIKECYEMVGSNYEKVVERLGSEGLVQRFALKFLKDGTYQELKTAMENGQGEAAFQGAHTLKGVCLNLGFDRLGMTASEMTEAMRKEKNVEDGRAFMETITAEYEKLIGLLQEAAKEV